MTLSRLLAFAAVLLAVVNTSSAYGAKRVALVIGNSSYENVARLPNPINDAAAIAATLRDAGFVVDGRQNLKIAETRRALRDFADVSRDADIAVVFYAGHGIEVDGANYLIPVDATLERDLDVYDEAVSLDRVLVSIEPAKQLRLVMLDACRDNPFAKTMKRTTAMRSVGRGLAKVEPTNPNTLIAFASKAGSTAADGENKNSPFTAALMKHLVTPGLDLRRAFGYVRDEVMKVTGNRQEPYVYGSLGGDDVPLVPAKTLVPSPNAQADVRRDYEMAERIGTRDVWTAFIAQYPDGLYNTLAKAQLDKIASTEKRPPAYEPQATSPKEETGKPKELAALPPPTSQLKPVDATKSLQLELKRVGCLSTPVSDDWSDSAQRGLTLFNKHAGTKFDVKSSSAEALEAVKTKDARVCPLICENGFKVGTNNKCKKVPEPKPLIAREPSKAKRSVESKQVEPPKPQASGQIVCTQQGCRPLRAGCRAAIPRSGSLAYQTESCN